MNKLADKLADLWKGFKSRLAEIRGGISKLNSQENDYVNRPIDGNEMQQKHLHPEIDAGERESESDLLSLQRVLDPKSPLVFPRTYNPNQDITMLINRFHFFCAEIQKEKLKKLFADKWSKDAVTSEDRQHKLKEIRSARAALEREEEQAIQELETQGTRVDRRPDETPEVFLEWNNGTFNQSKLSEFHRESLGRQAAINNLSQEIGGISSQIRELDSLFQRAELSADKARLEKPLQSLRSERDKLTSKRDELEQEYQPRLKLYNRAADFLREHGIRV